MHPVDAVLKRFNQEGHPDRRKYHADRHRKFHDNFKRNIFGHHKELFTRKLILRLIFLHNISQKQPENQIRFLDPKALDVEFMGVMMEMYENMHKQEAADKAVTAARKKFNYADPEQKRGA
jgi:hypothetical protein